MDYGLHIFGESVPAHYYSLLKILLMLQWKIFDAYFTRQANKKYSTFQYRNKEFFHSFLSFGKEPILDNGLETKVKTIISLEPNYTTFT